MSRRAMLMTGGIVTVVTGGVASLLGWRKAAQTVDGVQKAVSSGALVSLRLTGYWPFQEGLDAAGRKMEGGATDRKGKPLHTVEDYIAGKSDHVSLSGDDSIWPYGQKVVIPWGDRNVVGRVTDTGSHFRGAKKMVRAIGYEPIDVCVASSSTKIPKVLVDAQVIAGDTYDKPSKLVAFDKLGKPSSEVGDGLDCFGTDSPAWAWILTQKPDVDDWRWRAAAVQYASAHDDGGCWERGQFGLWNWRADDGTFNSMPPSLMKELHPGLAALIDFGKRG